MKLYVTCSWRYLVTKVLQCGSKKFFYSTRMPKRSLQSPPEKKLKPNQSTTNSIKTVTTLTEHNLNSTSMVVDNMQSENQVENEENCLTDTSHIKVTYLDPPVKSENDKKEYR